MATNEKYRGHAFTEHFTSCPRDETNVELSFVTTKFTKDDRIIDVSITLLLKLPKVQM